MLTYELLKIFKNNVKDTFVIVFEHVRLKST